MSRAHIEVGPHVDGAFARALAPALELLAARDDLPDDSAVALGAPSASAFGALLGARALVVVPAHADHAEPYLAGLLEHARVVLDVDPPAPPPGAPAAGVAAVDGGDPRAAEALALVDGLGIPRPVAPHPVRVVSGTLPGGVLQAREAWAGGAAVVAMPGPAGDALGATRAALVARTTLKAAEAVALLERTPRLAMAFASRGARSLKELPDAQGVADALASALWRAAGR